MPISFPWLHGRRCEASLECATAQPAIEPTIDRRRFLGGLLAASGCLTANASLLPSTAAAKLIWPEDRWLNLVNANTGEVFGEWYVIGGKYSKDAYHRFCWFARDWRENKAIQMHPSLMDLLYALHQEFRQDTIRVNSGYRTPKTNAKLEGAALRSQHLRGTALDVVVPQRSSRDVADLVRDLIPGGVGWYPKSGFVHADLGPYRSWRG